MRHVECFNFFGFRVGWLQGSSARVILGLCGLLGGLWIVISGVIRPLIWVVVIVTLLGFRVRTYFLGEFGVAVDSKPYGSMYPNSIYFGLKILPI